MESFANALRQLPSIIAENGGYDSAELVSELKALHATGNQTKGLDMYEVSDKSYWTCKVCTVHCTRRPLARRLRTSKYCYLFYKSLYHIVATVYAEFIAVFLRWSLHIMHTPCTRHPLCLGFYLAFLQTSDSLYVMIYFLVKKVFFPMKIIFRSLV